MPQNARKASELRGLTWNGKMRDGPENVFIAVIYCHCILNVTNLQFYQMFFFRYTLVPIPFSVVLGPDLLWRTQNLQQKITFYEHYFHLNDITYTLANLNGWQNKTKIRKLTDKIKFNLKNSQTICRQPYKSLNSF